MKRKERWWMYDRYDGGNARRLRPEFVDGVEQFIRFCEAHPESPGINEEANQKKLDESSIQEGSQSDPNQLYWEVVGGRKKDVVKGLGASASLFYTPSSEKGSQSYNPSIASQLEERVQAEVAERIEEAKVQMQEQFATQLQETMKKEREEAAIESKRMMETMLQNLFSNCSGGPPFQFRREDDPDMSGGGLGHQTLVS